MLDDVLVEVLVELLVLDDVLVEVLVELLVLDDVLVEVLVELDVDVVVANVSYILFHTGVVPDVAVWM